MENVLERMERTGAREFAKEFMEMQKWPYERKLFHATAKTGDFINECNRRGLNYHVSVGGLDSITLLMFLRDLKIGRHGWRLERPTRFDPPIPERGKQGLWELREALYP